MVRKTFPSSPSPHKIALCTSLKHRNFQCCAKCTNVSSSVQVIFPVCSTCVTEGDGGGKALPPTAKSFAHLAMGFQALATGAEELGAGFNFQCCPIPKPGSYLAANKCWLPSPGYERHGGSRLPGCSMSQLFSGTAETTAISACAGRGPQRRWGLREPSFRTSCSSPNSPPAARNTPSQLLLTQPGPSSCNL